MPGERATREAFFDRAAEHCPVLAVDTRHGRFLVSTQDAVIGRSLFAKRARGEMATLRRVLRVLQELGEDPRRGEGLLVDIGANIGTTTISGTVRCGFAAALAIEPAPENLRLLRANLALNGLEQRVRVVEGIASDHEGDATLALHPSNSGDHRVPNSVDDGERRQEITVRSTTLDALAAAGELLRPGLVWIDAQGHEGRILAGARALLATGVPIVMELWPSALRAAGDLDAVVTTLREYYTHVVDLGAPEDRRDLRPVSGLTSLADAQRDAFTDLLLLRRDGLSG